LENRQMAADSIFLQVHLHNGRRRSLSGWCGDSIMNLEDRLSLSPVLMLGGWSWRCFFSKHLELLMWTFNHHFYNRNFYFRWI